MRLAFVTETYPPEVNGVSLTVRALIERLRDRGHSVDIARPWQPSDGKGARGLYADDGDLLAHSHAVPRYPGLRFGWPAGRRLQRRWRTQRPDAVYVATEGPLGFSALRAARALRIPVLTGFHTRFDAYLDHYRVGALAPLAARWLRHFHNRAQATLVPTPALQEELAGRGIENVWLLRRGIDTERFSPRWRSEALRAGWGLQPEDIAILHVGRIAPEKNLELLRDAFIAIRAHDARARLVVVGDGPARAALVEWLPDAVLCGVRSGEDLSAHYASGDLFLFPSLSETFGNVTLEALASGVPVVAYAEGAALEQLRTGHNGAAVVSGDSAAFVSACVRLVEDPAQLRALAANARNSVEHLRPLQVAIDFERLVVRATGVDAEIETPEDAALPACKETGT